MPPSNTLIAGASSDIGCEIIRRIDEKEGVIYAHYHKNREKIDAIVPSLSGKIIAVGADLGTVSGVETLIKDIESYCDFPEKIVLLPSPKVANVRFKDLSWQDFQAHLDIQVRAASMILGRFLPKMARAKRGKVVFMLSSYTIGVPPPSMANYVTAKYALMGLMKALASEYAGKRITINGISPSMVNTRFLSKINEKIVELESQRNPLGRVAVPSDVAPLVKFLLSDESAYMTGVNIPVTGGMEF